MKSTIKYILVYIPWEYSGRKQTKQQEKYWLANCQCLKHTQDVPQSSHCFLLLWSTAEFHDSLVHAHHPLIWWDQKWQRFSTNSATNLSSLFGYPAEYQGLGFRVNPHQRRSKVLITVKSCPVGPELHPSFDASSPPGWLLSTKSWNFIK
jgi:hypothetical protein